MSAVLLGNAPHDSEEWHALRAGGIGASEIAAVVGLSKWTSPYALWHRKRGNLAPQGSSSAMEWGNLLEPVIVDWFRRQHPEWDVTASPGTFAHAERPFQRVNPDGFIDGDDLPERELLQIKTSRFGDGYGKPGTDQVPLDVRCQEQYELDVFGLQRARVVVLVGGNDPREYFVEANPEDQATLREAATRFWNSIENDEAPPLDASDHTYRAVVELNPDLLKDEFIDLTPDTWAKYLKAKANVNHAEGELTLAKTEILHAMRGNQYARFAGDKVIRRQRSSAGTYYLKEV